jgi:hypothetical protein
MITMPFVKGDKRINRSGRPQGAINRSTEQMKLTLARAVNNTLNTLSEDLERIRQDNPDRAVELSLKLMEFVVPKLSRTEMKAEIEQKIQAINININRKELGTND